MCLLIVRGGQVEQRLPEEGVGVADGAHEAGRVTELRERGARQYLVVERGHDALGRLRVVLVVVPDVVRQFHRPQLH